MVMATDKQEARAAEAVVEAKAIRAAAVDRKRRERFVEYVSYTESERLRARLDGRELRSTGVYADTYRAPSGLSEFFDDMIIAASEVDWDPAWPVAIRIADAGRESAAAAMAAVKQARHLDPAAQWTLFRNISRWSVHTDVRRTGAEPVVKAVLAAWHQLGLQDTDPALSRVQRHVRRAIDGD